MLILCRRPTLNPTFTVIQKECSGIQGPSDPLIGVQATVATFTYQANSWPTTRPYAASERALRPLDIRSDFAAHLNGLYEGRRCPLMRQSSAQVTLSGV